MYVCMLTNSKGLTKISVANDHTKILESHDYVFKVFVILRLYGQKRQFQEVQSDKTKIQPDMTKGLKTDF